MDFLANLKKLLGIQEQQKPVQRPVSGAEQRYNSAFDRGDLNSPDIIGVDPAQFGYAEDVGQYGGRPQLNLPQPSRIAGLQALTNFKPSIPLNPAFGTGDQWDVNSPEAIYPPNDPRSRSKFRF